MVLGRPPLRNNTPREAELTARDFGQYSPGDGEPVTQPTAAYLSCDGKVTDGVEDDPSRDTLWHSEGRIINLSTDAAHAHASSLSYAASKHAIESYSRSAAAEVGKYGITVNIIAPGPIQIGWLTPDQDVAISAGTPLRRCGVPQDVADVMVFLASDQAHWLTGQLLYVGGGWRMHQ